jgi:oligoendopeptidase F
LAQNPQPELFAVHRPRKLFERGTQRQSRMAELELLGRSDFDRTYQMLNEVGIDLTKPEPYQNMVNRMNRQLNELQSLLDTGK